MAEVLKFDSRMPQLAGIHVLSRVEAYLTICEGFAISFFPPVGCNAILTPQVTNPRDTNPQWPPWLFFFFYFIDYYFILSLILIRRTRLYAVWS